MGAKGAIGNNRGVGGVWRSAHGASCQSRSCARSADKEGESVLIWAGIQSNLDWDVGGGGPENVGTRLTKAFMLGGGLNGQKDTGSGCFSLQRRRGTRASGILFTQQRLKSVKRVFSGNYDSLWEVLSADLQ